MRRLGLQVQGTQLSVNVNDHTGQLWLSCFDDVGRIIMGRSADEIMELRENSEENATALFEAANCTKLNFRCRAKMDTYGDNQRYVFLHVMDLALSPLPFVSQLTSRLFTGSDTRS